MDGSVLDAGFFSVKVRQRVLHPVLVVPVRAVLPGVCPAGFLAVFRPGDGGRGAGYQVLQFQGLDQVRVPDQRLVGDHHVLVEFLDHIVDLDHSLLQRFVITVYGRVFLHGLLELGANRGRGNCALSVAERVEVLQRFHALVFLHGGDLVSRFVVLGNLESASPAKDDDVQQRIGPESVGPVDTGGGNLPGGKESGDRLVLHPGLVLVGGVGIVVGRLEDLPVVIGGDASHVVVDSGQRGDGFLGDVDAGKNSCRFGDSWQSLRQQVSGEVVEVQVDVILLGADTPSLPNLHGHGPGYHVPGRQILGTGRVSLHKALSLAVSKDSTLPAASLRHQTTGPVNPRGVELNKLVVLVGDPLAERHGVSVPRAGVGRGAGKVGPAVPAGGQNRVLGADPVHAPVLHVQHNDADALGPVLAHEQIQAKVLDEIGRVKGQGASVQCVEHGVTGPIGGGAAAVCLSALAVLKRLAPKGPLVDLSVLGSAKGHSERLELDDRLRSLPAHVMDGILVSEPVASLDRVVHVPPPVVLGHVAEGGVDSALGCHRVRASGKELGHAGRLESGFRQPHGGTQTRTSGADHYGVVLVVHDRVVALQSGGDAALEHARSSGSRSRNRRSGGSALAEALNGGRQHGNWQLEVGNWKLDYTWCVRVWDVRFVVCDWFGFTSYCS
mmetsp:Transcript_26177/g.71816  ORF Transcript_26177/g.71816 Transcript_26177/m.71816 type:complete len:667 (-) Transcript_26177:261-2261(-)